MTSIYSKIVSIESSTDKAALCIITATKGSTPRKTGAKMIVFQNGKSKGSIGGGKLESVVIKDAIAVIYQKKAKNFSHALIQDHGMCCGGQVEIYIEPIMNTNQLFIFGAGHIGKHLSFLASQLNFDVTVIDEREEMIAQLPKGINILNKSHHMAFANLKFNENSYTCVITHDHAYDREIVAYCAVQPHAYLGMIGSQRKIETAKRTFLQFGTLTEQQMEHIDWPMGLDIKVNTPEEIAISIMAKIIDVKNRKLAAF